MRMPLLKLHFDKIRLDITFIYFFESVISNGIHIIEITYPKPAVRRKNTTTGNINHTMAPRQLMATVTRRLKKPAIMVAARIPKPTRRISVLIAKTPKKLSSLPLPPEMASLRHGENKVLDKSAIEKKLLTNQR